VAVTRRFSLPILLCGLLFLVLSLVFGLVTFYFLAWGVGEEEGSAAAQVTSGLLLACFAAYALLVAPFIWPRVRSSRAKVLVLLPYLGFLSLAGIGMIRG
jgi:cytochrome bd-type quinol oxidase subunit 2